MADESKEARGTDGRFKKGVSGNKKGRPPLSASIHAFMEEVVVVKDGDADVKVARRDAVLAALYKTALTSTARDQMKAAELLLAYDFGRPRERVEMSGPRGGPIETDNKTTVEERRATTGELRKRLDELDAKRAAARQKANGGTNSDGEGPEAA